MTYTLRMPPTASTTRPVLARWQGVLLALVGVAAFGLILRAMGRQWLSDSGFGLWTGAWTTNTSQWIADPYTTSHVLHGVFFFWLLWPARRWLPLGARWAIAALIEAGWELLENSPIIIDRYRGATASLEYYGDSILNSTCDLLAAIFGFWLASRLGWKWSLALVVVVELLMLLAVRDNLTLNVLMLVYPSESIKAWQLGH